ncbi:MAG: RdgB/HAM1 family non-canonical purine NTP pyrophosphatase [Candidatus Peribacteria bacterium]|jgi:non-canonical purine NTP pyrophosphatase (RdgB/HAM1 family)|nr:RdgB/HAM1 family non-canonical purine NTP pyrophosphatase [Candidatus Peribacteria bacterium]
MKFVTGNHHKREEANAIVGGNLEMVSIDLAEIQSIDVVEVISHKAKAAYEALGEPALCEDVGLVFNAWNGLPGAQIKRFMQTVGREGILKMLSGFDDRSARAVCCVGRYDGKEVHHVLGVCEGGIATSVRGESGFGFDPIFLPQGHEQTFAEMPKEAKNQISHRYLAWKQVNELIYIS